MPVVAIYVSELVWCSLWSKYNPHNVISLTNYRLLPDQKGCHNFRFISDSNVFGRSVRHCSGIKAIRHLQFNIHSSLLQLKSFHHLSPNYISSFKSMNYYIYFFQIKMFVQDLTTITNEIKRMELPGTSIVPPSSSWFESCSVQCNIFIVLEIKTKTSKNIFRMETGAFSFGTNFIIYNIWSQFTCFEWRYISRFNKI